MEAQRVSDELLKLILTKLHRLETRFNEIDNRLGSIEYSMLPAAGSSSPIIAGSPLSGSSRRCSCHIPQPVFQDFNLDWKRHVTASAYQASVDKLRSRFEFDDQSEIAPQDIGVASTYDGPSEVVDAYIDNCSVSVYPSRPVSNFGFHINNELRPGVGVPELPSLRYDDIAPAEEPAANPDSGSRSVSTISTSRTLSTQQNSTSTARTSIALSSASGSPSAPVSFSKMRGSIKRATSLSIPRRKIPMKEAGNVVDNTADNNDVDFSAERIHAAAVKPEELERFIQMARKSAKTCVSFVPNMVTGLAKRMMNQQLKMLDVAA